MSPSAPAAQGVMMPGDVWEVVGGAGSGGIIVREGQGRSSPEVAKRLATGALVKVLENDAGRLRYELLAGEGPSGGWVSSSLKGKDLLVKANLQEMMEPQGAEQDEIAKPEPKVCTALRQDLSLALPTSGAEAAEEDSEEEDEGCAKLLCSQCRLPLGQVCYDKDGDGQHVHAECMAQLLLSAMRQEDEARRQREAASKKTVREEYDIGWKVERIPSNLGFAEKLEGFAPPEGMCCLVFEKGTRKVRTAATCQPAAAVNLEYLFLALQVRRKEGREPLFSLDPLPKEATDDVGRPLQAKRFDPEWLANTSVGDVLFQADYHLKELSMGEYEQPVLGMRSCLDFCEAEGHDQQWRAREWFVVNKAEIHLTEDNILLPHLQMGVEAREQISGEHGFEDAKITRADHPLVKYAEEFTRNFDLIAERKSVIYHLRELAKASILAKVIVDGQIESEEPWFTTDLELKAEANLAAIPQLWNDRCYSKLHVQGGRLQDVRNGVAAKMHGVYGGVHFGLDRLRLASVAVDRQPIGLQHRVPRSTFFPTEKAVRIPRGVDLSLNQFDLSDPARPIEASAALSDRDVLLGNDFWPSLALSNASALKEEDRSLYRGVFNPHLSDRREEGERFVPPGSFFSYADRLRELLKAEEGVQQQRREHFLSARFAADDAGPLFPASWTESLEIEGKQAPSGAQSGSLQPRADYKDASLLLQCMMRSAAPVFDKTAEDGCRFRIYRFGSVEARTTQEHDGEEELGAVFSVRPPTEAAPGGVWTRTVDEREKLVRATEFVERALRRQQAGAEPCQRPFYRRYYVVFETEQGNKIVTEQLSDGIVTFEENPEDLEDRNSLAKVFRSIGCSTAGAGTTVRDIKVRQMKEFQQRSASKAVVRKRYSDIAYSWAVKEELAPRPLPAPQPEKRAVQAPRPPASLRFAMSAGAGFGAGDRQPLGSAGRKKLGERNCFKNLF